MAASTRSRPAAYANFIEPRHASEQDRPLARDKWIHEVKVGYRAQLHVRDNGIVVYSRRGHDSTDTFASIARAAEQVPVRHCVLDGVAIVQDGRGLADYHALRTEPARKRSGPLTWKAKTCASSLDYAQKKLKALVANAPHGFPRIYARAGLRGARAATYAFASLRCAS